MELSAAISKQEWLHSIAKKFEAELSVARANVALQTLLREKS